MNKHKDKKVEQVWGGMEDIPFNEVEDGSLTISRNYHTFKKGTYREDIWHWFDKNHSKGITYLLYNLQ